MKNKIDCYHFKEKQREILCFVHSYLSSILSRPSSYVTWYTILLTGKKIMDLDYQLILNIVLLVLAIVLIFISLVLIYCQTFSLKVDVGLLIIPTCCMILLLIFYVSQLQSYFGVSSARKIDLILLSVSGLFSLLFFILIGALMIYCQRVNEANNIEAENHISLLKDSRGPSISVYPKSISILSQ